MTFYYVKHPKGIRVYNDNDPEEGQSILLVRLDKDKWGLLIGNGNRVGKFFSTAQDARDFLEAMFDPRWNAKTVVSPELDGILIGPKVIQKAVDDWDSISDITV